MRKLKIIIIIIHVDVALANQLLLMSFSFMRRYCEIQTFSYKETKILMRGVQLNSLIVWFLKFAPPTWGIDFMQLFLKS